jgi:hypothetical protein
MSKHNVAITILGTIAVVPVIDKPVKIEVTFASQESIVLPIGGPYMASFVVDEGNYDGTIRSIRADGSVIGTPIRFNIIVAAETVEVFVPVSISVAVTPVTPLV